VADSGKNWCPRGLKVWVLMYSHEHGIDTSVYGSEERALKSATEIIMRWIGDVEERDEDAADEIKKLVASGDHRQALETWQEWQYSGDEAEVISIELLDVQ
jgi:hypothetical protein